MIKPQLQVKFAQQLVMTPQLQQSIRLLQYSTLELQAAIAQAIEENPLLELDEPFEEMAISLDVHQNNESETLSVTEALENRQMPNELLLDTSFDDIYLPDFSAPASDYARLFSASDNAKTAHSLQEHLLWQARLTHFTEQEMVIAMAIIDAVNTNGYLTTSLTDILDSLGNEHQTIKDIEFVLKRIQQFDPVGVAARNLQESLLCQLMQYPPETPYLAEAQKLVSQHLEAIGTHSLKSLAKVTQLAVDTLTSAILLIKTLNPYPGKLIDNDAPEYIIPDIFVKKYQGKWHVFFNDDSIPPVRINQEYANLGKTLTNDGDQQFIRTHLQQAHWLIKSIENRNDTLLKVSRCIVDYQQAFFEHGEEYLKPMILSDVAKTIDMHESTISRATTAKYLQCPRGVFELKYFFSSHLQTRQGEEASSTAIKALIKRCISDESPTKPLSDSKIAQFLENKGIMVARRTVAKYRELLGIAPSSQRKKIF